MNIFFQWLSGLITILLAVFPNSNPSTEATITNSTVLVRQFLLTAGYFFPINLFLTLLAIIIVTETSIIAIKITSWILHTVTVGFFKRP